MKLKVHWIAGNAHFKYGLMHLQLKYTIIIWAGPEYAGSTHVSEVADLVRGVK